MGAQVQIVGWLENVREVGANLAFAVIRDFYGTTQAVCETEELVKAFREASEGSLKGIMSVNDLPLVSSDFKGSQFSSIVESEYCTVQDGTLAKVVSWYDNEWGYSVRVADLICHMQSKGL